MDGEDGSERSPWREGPEEEIPASSWLSLSDDELLHTIETVGAQHDADERLVEVVASTRHFFIRQEAAKRVRRKKLLFPYEDDRHIGQILVRHLNRREDLTYLERLMARSNHADVRKAAGVQLARLRKRLFDLERREATRQKAGTAPWGVLVVHADPEVRRQIAEMLSPPEFEVLGEATAAQGAAVLNTQGPHLLLAGIDELRGTELPAALRCRTPPPPVVALCPLASAAQLSDVAGGVAQDFMLLPLQPGLLVGKAQALLHLAYVAAGRAERRKASGTIGGEGVLPLIRLCEEEQLTCRLAVIGEGFRYFADFMDGEMTEAGGVPALAEDAALNAILGVTAGTYEIIEARPLETGAEAEETIEVPVPQGIVAPAPAPAAASSTPAAPPAEASPWQVPDVDATLLGWAVHFVVEQAWAYLGTAVTAGLLRRTLQDGVGTHPVLRIFIVEENAHVSIDLTQGARVPSEAVGVTAQWMAVFLGAARRIAPDASAIDVRAATRIVAAALEQVDFYAAYDRAIASQHEAKPTSHVIGSIFPPRRRS